LKPDKEIITKRHYTGKDQLLFASHWVNNEGDWIKLTPAFKLYWQYRFDTCKAFSTKGKRYYETIKTACDKVGISVDSAKGFHKILVSMNLLTTKGHSLNSDHNFSYLFLPLTSLEGYLVNPSLKGKKPNKQKDRTQDKDTITYKEIKTLEKNQREVKRWNSETDKEIKGIPKDEYIRLKRLEMEIKQQQESEEM